MKIMYLLDTHLSNGGAPISSHKIAFEISGYHETLIAFPQISNGSKTIESNLEYYEFNTEEDRIPIFFLHPIKSLKFAKEIISLMKRFEPDIIHAQMPKVGWIVGILKITKFIPTKVKLVYTDREHMQNYGRILKSISIFLINFPYTRIVCLTSISQNFWSQFTLTNKQVVIPNFAGSEFEIFDQKKKDLLKKNVLGEGVELTVMFAGRLSKVKNWPFAEEIISQNSNKPIKFIVILSTDNLEQEEEFRRLRNRVMTYNTNVTIVHNASLEQISDYFYCADLFILTSHSESFGRTAIEAMSRRCCVIGPNVGGLPEVIGRKDNVFEHKVELFSNKIDYYLDYPEELEMEKDWFFTRFKENYTSLQSVVKHNEIYEDINPSDIG